MCTSFLQNYFFFQTSSVIYLTPNNGKKGFWNALISKINKPTSFANRSKFFFLARIWLAMLYNSRWAESAGPWLAIISDASVRWKLQAGVPCHASDQCRWWGLYYWPMSKKSDGVPKWSVPMFFWFLENYRNLFVRKKKFNYLNFFLKKKKGKTIGLRSGMRERNETCMALADVRNFVPIVDLVTRTSWQEASCSMCGWRAKTNFSRTTAVASSLRMLLVLREDVRYPRSYSNTLIVTRWTKRSNI